MRSILQILLLLQALLVVAAPPSQHSNAQDSFNINDLVKRKGGGGGGGKGGSSGSSSSGSSSSGSSSSGSSGSSGARTGTGSNTGGATSAGSGAPRTYGGGSYYGGGATRPFAAGSSSPRGLGAAGLLPIAGLGFFGGAWLYGAYLYSYPHPYSFYNRSAMANQTKPVDCLCQQYSECGCDDQDNNSFLDDVIGNGSYASLNSSLIRVADVNGTSTIILNGTLPNGTTAAGGTDDDDTSAANALNAQRLGWMALVAAGSAAVWSL